MANPKSGGSALQLNSSLWRKKRSTYAHWLAEGIVDRRETFLCPAILPASACRQQGQQRR
jgi:hypothetical protein